MKEFKFEVTITEVQQATITIEADSFEKAKQIIEDREFDWDCVKYYDTESIDIDFDEDR